MKQLVLFNGIGGIIFIYEIKGVFGKFLETYFRFSNTKNTSQTSVIPMSFQMWPSPLI